MSLFHSPFSADDTRLHIRFADTKSWDNRIGTAWGMLASEGSFEVIVLEILPVDIKRSYGINARPDEYTVFSDGGNDDLH